MAEDEIYRKVKDILVSNIVTGYAKSKSTEFFYIKPAKKTYPFQYFWDTCFHVFILTALGEHETAKRSILSLFAMQQDNGFVGHILYWNNILPARLTDTFQSKPGLKTELLRSHMSALIQPPIVAQAVLRIYQKTEDQDFLHHMLPKLKKYYQWLADNRDFYGDGLLSSITAFESGMDWKPTFDPVVGFPEKKADWRLFWRVVSVDMRNFFHNYDLEKIREKNYFVVKDPGTNTIYAQNLRAMATLCEIAGDTETAKKYTALSEKVVHSMLRLMYDDASAAFYDILGKSNEKIKILTPTIFFPLVCQGIPDAIEKKIIDRHLFNEKEFKVRFPIPSVSLNHPSFNPTGSLYIWRGPTWVVSNWFLHQFMIEKGYREESKAMVDSIKKLVQKSGFREYYHPFTGKGYGAHDFTWAGLVVDMMEMEKDFPH